MYITMYLSNNDSNIGEKNVWGKLWSSEGLNILVQQFLAKMLPEVATKS